MASRTMDQIGLCFALITVLPWGHASAQTFGCTSVIFSLAPCLSYLRGSSSSTPSSSCCTHLSTVVQNQPHCLCEALGGGGPLGLTINKTQALALPGACKIQTPPVSRCNAAAGAPAEAPPPSSNATLAIPLAPSVPSPKDAPVASSVMVAVGLAVCVSSFI